MGTSGAEYSEDDFKIASNPDKNGFYKFEAKTTKDTGGPDCSGGSEDNTGNSWTMYVLFSADKKTHLACTEPNMDSCWGRYTKVGN
jgi:hypothetical protein